MSSPATMMNAFLEKHSVVKVLPENTNRILRLTSDKECDINRLIKVIAQDAALAGSIMKAANSAYYALQSKVTRLDRAVTVMGLRAVKEVTISSCFSSMCKPIRLGKYGARDLWDHTVGVAILARELAIHSKTLDPEEVFLAGIMHDLALLLALQSEVEMATALVAKADGGSDPFLEQERKVFGFSHCEFGEKLGTEWQLAPQLIAAIRWHHDPESAPAEYQAMARHIYVADTLCCAARVGFPLTCGQQQVSPETYQKATIDGEVAAALSAKLPILLRLHMA